MIRIIAESPEDVASLPPLTIVKDGAYVYQREVNGEWTSTDGGTWSSFDVWDHEGTGVEIVRMGEPLPLRELLERAGADTEHIEMFSRDAVSFSPSSRDINLAQNREDR